MIILCIIAMAASFTAYWRAEKRIAMMMVRRMRCSLERALRWLAGLAGRRGEPGDAGLVIGPAVAAFLSGATVRQAAYLFQGTDPAVNAAAPDWPAMVRAVEGGIRAYVARLEDQIAVLDDQIAELRGN